ncbi:MAG: hypothetical protein ABEK00_01005, partial [Candidatus Nanohaloarchaea archaeon]
DSTLEEIPEEKSKEYQDPNPKNLPVVDSGEEESMITRRRLLGGAAGLGLLGAGGVIGYILGEDEKSTAPEEKLSMGERYDLSEVEKCAAEYQMEQVNLYLDEEGLESEDIKVEMTTDGRLEVYRENGSKPLYTTDDVAGWTCELE